MLSLICNNNNINNYFNDEYYIIYYIKELGPRFTLKLKWLQEGTFDTAFGEYEFINKRKEDTSRRKFNL